MGVVGVFRDIGPAEVWFNGAKVGESAGNVVFRFKTASRAVREDAKGVAPVDFVKMGMEECSVEVPLTRMTHAQLVAVIPGAERSGSGVNEQMFVYSEVGFACAENAAPLLLKPIFENGVTTDESDWLALPAAYPVDVDSEIIFNTDDQRVYPVMFRAFPATVNSIEGVYWGAGDLSAD